MRAACPNRSRSFLLVAAVVVLALLTVGCRPGEPATNLGPSRDAVLAAHQAVQSAATKLRTSDVSFTIDMSVTGWNTWRTHGTGQIMAEPSSSMAVDFPGMPVVPHWLYGGGNLQMILIDQALYVHASALSPEAARSIEAGGAQWQRMDLSHPQARLLGLDTIVGQARQYTPARQLEMLLASADLASVATETTGGIDTTRYEGAVRLRDAVRLPQFDDVAVRWVEEFFRVAQADLAQYVVWLDRDLRVSKVSVTMRSENGDLNMTMELSPPDSSIQILAPPRSAVDDMVMP